MEEPAGAGHSVTLLNRTPKFNRYVLRMRIKEQRTNIVKTNLKKRSDGGFKFCQVFHSIGRTIKQSTNRYV